MHRNHELLPNEELYIHCGEVIKKNIAAIKRQVFSTRDYLCKRKHEIVQELRTKNTRSEDAMQSVKSIYNNVLEELMRMEEICDEYRARINVELSAETMGRLQPPSYVSMAPIRKAFQQISKCCETVLEPEEISRAKSTWTNIPDGILQDTTDILNKPQDVPTEFDETDVKFKQEMTALRTKIFPAAEMRLNENVGKRSFSNNHARHVDARRTKDFIEAVRKHDIFVPRGNDTLAEVQSLKFVDGEFAACEIWSRALDANGRQLRSKWLLVFCPQMAKIMRKRHIHTLHLNPAATFDFISSIRENGFNFLLTRRHLLSLLENASEAPWLTGWNLQFRTIEGKNIAATLIQALWRGYWLRQRIRESERRYIAASVLWFAWISLLKTRQMQQRYHDKMRASLNITRQLSLNFSNDFDRFITEPHVVLHIPSLGHPLEIRRTIGPKALAVRQNVMSLKISFARNPYSEVIYVLPVQPSEELLSMYQDVVDSVDVGGIATKRITYVTLSEAKTFERRSMNVSRILHCSEASLQAIRKKIAGKPAYILPWIVDDGDVKLADLLGLPMMSPDLELQRELLNFSRLSEIVEGLGLPQPAHARNIKDYETMCDTLAELIVVNTEICTWLIRLNYGVQTKHCGAFVINHISVPFMPLLRKERAKFGDEWRINPGLRVQFLDDLSRQLPKIVSRVTKLSSYYTSWKDFYAHVQKFGCLLQAVPDERNATTVAASLFVPGIATGDKPRWIGTADKIHFDASFMTFAYMLPQTSIDSTRFEPTVNKFALAMQRRGYFGYLTIDCYCYPHKYEENIVVLVLDIHPYYCLVQQYNDWVKFAIGGWYSKATNTLNADVAVSPQVRRGKSLYAVKPPKWNETSERYAIAVLQLHHDRFPSYSWPQLKTIIEDCGILYDATRKEGSHLILHDNEMRNSATFTVISSSMNTALTAAHSILSKLYDALRAESKEKPDTNLQDIVNFFVNLSLKYRNISADRCE